MNMQNMMRQAQKLQKQMEQSQAELAATEFVGTSAQNLVTATLTGDKKVVKIDFDPAVVDPEDIETLSDMTVQALNTALEQIDETTKKKLGAFAGKLPFELDYQKEAGTQPLLIYVKKQIIQLLYLAISHYIQDLPEQFLVLLLFFPSHP